MRHVPIAGSPAFVCQFVEDFWRDFSKDASKIHDCDKEEESSSDRGAVAQMPQDISAVNG